MATLHARSASATHVGRVREVNEDGVFDRPDLGLWAVADGMGGHGDGDLASGAIIEAMAALSQPTSALEMRREFERQVEAAHRRLHELSAERGGVVGATLVALLRFEAHFACLWCGDSRAYLYRRGELAQLSHDHSRAQDLVDGGVMSPEEARVWRGRNVVTRALGVEGEVELDMVDGPLAPGDRILLCSDGLTGHVQDSEIARALGVRGPEEACAALVALTLERGAEDNVSLIVVAFEEHGL